MGWLHYLTHGLQFAGHFSPEIGLLLFAIGFLSEAFSIAVPYLMETTWMAVGYQFARGVTSLTDIVLMEATIIAGREAGALLLFVIGRGLIEGLSRLLKRLHIARDVSNTGPGRLFRRINPLNPFWVALGRLLWLRIPLTLALSAARRPRVLVIAIVISSVVYDGVYITLGGVVGTTVKLDPLRTVLLFLGLVTAIYLLVFGIRWLVRLISGRRQRTTETRRPPGTG